MDDLRAPVEGAMTMKEALRMGDEARTLDTIEIGRLIELLPHRYPFLLIDRIVDVDGDESAVGIKNVTINEQFFVGHFPGRPIMPGVLLIEGMAQTAGAICLHAFGNGIPHVVYFMTIDEAKFRKPVVPGDTVEYRLQKVRNRANVWKYSGEAWVRDSKVAEAVISALISDR
jgi:3-hydroxyacyl-[acyl-carrier-protein] dehydratase